MAPCRKWCWLVFCLSCVMAARAQVSVPAVPPPDAKAQPFRDGHFGVRFQVPGGWTLARKDGQVSTFHLDARTAPRKAQVRGVVAIQFNPYPYSTFSGALFYYSVEPHTTDEECSKQASGFVTARAVEANAVESGPAESSSAEGSSKDVQDIGGMRFEHGHDEHGNICVEARDEVYTAYRKGACYRFDLAMNTFCSVSSGAADMTDAQLEQIDQRMADILSTVKLDWEKAGPHPVPAPKVSAAPIQVPADVRPAILLGGQ